MNGSTLIVKWEIALVLGCPQEEWSVMQSLIIMLIAIEELIKNIKVASVYDIKMMRIENILYVVRQFLKVTKINLWKN